MPSPCPKIRVLANVVIVSSGGTESPFPSQRLATCFVCLGWNSDTTWGLRKSTDELEEQQSFSRDLSHQAKCCRVHDA